MQKTFDLHRGQKFVFKSDPTTVMMRVSEPIHNLEGYTVLSSRTFPNYVGSFFMFEGYPNVKGVSVNSKQDIELI